MVFTHRHHFKAGRDVGVTAAPGGGFPMARSSDHLRKFSKNPRGTGLLTQMVLRQDHHANHQYVEQKGARVLMCG